MLAPPRNGNPAADGNPGEVFSNNSASPQYSNSETDVKSFTSRKLDWLFHMSADRSVPPLSFKIGFVIVQHVNAQTGIAYLSDDVIREYVDADERTIRRGRRVLRDVWVSWTRTGTANAYKLLYGRIAAVADEIAQRRAERANRRNIERTPASDLENHDRTSVSADRTPMSGDRTPASVPRTPVSAIHLSSTPSDTPSNTPLFGALISSPVQIELPNRKNKKGNGTKRTRKTKTELPDDWVLSHEQWTFGAKLGLTGDQIEAAERKLKRWVKREGKRYVDWNSFAEDWLERELAFLRNTPRGGAADDRTGFSDFANGIDHG
jgi:hypothetical protein